MLVKGSQDIIGEFGGVTPFLQAGDYVGIIKDVTEVDGESKGMVLHIEFYSENRPPVIIKKRLFYSKVVNSEYVKTMSKLVKDFVAGEPFLKSVLVGVVLRAQIADCCVKDGKISVVKEILNKEEPEIGKFKI